MTLFASVNPALKEFSRAIVSSNQDPEQKGRIRLEYPWLGKSSAKLPSEWARVSLPYASKNHGSWSLPEVGDEVLVYFDNGNLESPLVIGSLYNEKNPPPRSGQSGDLNADNKNSLRFIRSRSGHVVGVDDSDSTRGIFLRDQEGRSIEIKSQAKVVEIKDAEGHRITLSASEINIENKEGSKVTIAGGKVSIQASGSIELGAGATEALVKGTSFMALFNAHTHTVGPATSTPPVTPMQPTMLSQKVKTV